MFDRNRIQQNFVAVFQQNIGNRITPELANGMIAVLMAAVPEISMHVENTEGGKANVNDTTTTSSDESANSVSEGAS